MLVLEPPFKKSWLRPCVSVRSFPRLTQNLSILSGHPSYNSPSYRRNTSYSSIMHLSMYCPTTPLGRKWGFTGGIDTKLLPHYEAFDDRSVSAQIFFVVTSRLRNVKSRVNPALQLVWQRPPLRIIILNQL